MRSRNNPLKNIPPQAFTIIRSTREDFIRDLADVPTRYPEGMIVYLSQLVTVPLLMVKEEHQDRILYKTADTLTDLLEEIEYSRCPVLFVQYTPAWFAGVGQEQMELCIETCRDRARKYGPVVMLAMIHNYFPQILKDGAHHTFEIHSTRPRGKLLEIKEQITIDQVSAVRSGPVGPHKMYGQVKLGV